MPPCVHQRALVRTETTFTLQRLNDLGVLIQGGTEDATA
jgi:hypothetical protein